jgi:inorganic pyrophosphatase
MDDTVMVRVEVPKGTRNKYEWDEEHQALVFDRRLFAAVTFPADYGEILGTLAGDGDPMDVIVCLTEPTFPGCLIRSRPIGVLWAVDAENGDRDDKIVCIPSGDPAWTRHQQADDLPGDLADEIGHFFTVYGDLQGKQLELEGWGSHADAMDLIRRGRKRAQQAA